MDYSNLIILGFMIFFGFIAFINKKDIMAKIESIGVKNIHKHYFKIFTLWLLRFVYAGTVCAIVDLVLYIVQGALGIENKWYIVPRGWG